MSKDRNNHKQINSCWVITEGIAGTENQCIGLAEALGIQPTIKRIALRFPWKQLTPPLTFGCQWAISKQSDPIEAPYPDLVIASGRKSIPAALKIKKQSKGKSFIVQVQDPRCNPDLFDMVILPEHDPTRGKNVITTTGSLNRITNEKLKTETEKFKDKLSKVSSPKVAVLIGGNSKAYSMNKAITEQLCDDLLKIADNYGLMITASRRTGKDNARILKDKLSNHPNIYFWDGQGDNPYFAYLGMADFILVTADSVSMISEALTTGKPTYIIPLQGGGKRIDAFHEQIIKADLARPFHLPLEPWEKEPFNETQRVAQIILGRYKEFHTIENS